MPSGRAVPSVVEPAEPLGEAESRPNRLAVESSRVAREAELETRDLPRQLSNNPD